MSKDSYTRPFLNALEEYSPVTVAMGVYFRNVDQSDPEIRRGMRHFVDDLSALPQVGQSPEFCWVRDMQLVLEDDDNESDLLVSSKHFERLDDAQKNMVAIMKDALRETNSTFEEKLLSVLNIPGVRDIYGEDIVWDDQGQVLESRCFIFIRHLDLKDITEQIQMLQDQYEVTLDQSINQVADGDPSEMAFFTFDTVVRDKRIQRYSIPWCSYFLTASVSLVHPLVLLLAIGTSRLWLAP